MLCAQHTLVTIKAISAAFGGMNEERFIDQSAVLANAGRKQTTNSGGNDDKMSVAELAIYIRGYNYAVSLAAGNNQAAVY